MEDVLNLWSCVRLQIVQALLSCVWILAMKANENCWGRVRRVYHNEKGISKICYEQRIKNNEDTLSRLILRHNYE
jgi:hypothetical protein